MKMPKSTKAGTPAKKLFGKKKPAEKIPPKTAAPLPVMPNEAPAPGPASMVPQLAKMMGGGGY